jgi:hypothetical protein
VAHISLVVREMWDSTALCLKLSIQQMRLVVNIRESHIRRRCGNQDTERTRRYSPRIHRSMSVWAQRAPHKCRTLAVWESITFQGVNFSIGCSGALGIKAAGSVNASHQSSASPLGLPQTSQW